ncbi:hypothetical protein ADL21_00160 [Streptomyces albus subsp. albus]|nr:hypothetical protein ADL21_00160 [Streptomyces albus subsp. albus]
MRVVFVHPLGGDRQVGMELLSETTGHIAPAGPRRVDVIAHRTGAVPALAFLAGCPSGLWWGGDRGAIPLVGHLARLGTVDYPDPMGLLRAVVGLGLLMVVASMVAWVLAGVPPLLMDLARRKNPLHRACRARP